MPKPVPHRAVLKSLPSGPIVLETGADGVWLRFECDCLDALPYCKAACCGLHGIDVEPREMGNKATVVGDDGKPKATTLQALTVLGEDGPEMMRGSDSFCRCLDRDTRRCTIYKDRPATCRDFHCTLGAEVRGWRLDFGRHHSAE